MKRAAVLSVLGITLIVSFLLVLLRPDSPEESRRVGRIVPAVAPADGGHDEAKHAPGVSCGSQLRSGRITGYVVDRDLAPIAGAELVLERYEGANVRLGEAATDAQGRFEISASGEKSYRLGARAEGFLHAYATGVQSGEEVSFLLWRAGVVRGIVRSLADGRPLEGVEIYVDAPYPDGFVFRNRWLSIHRHRWAKTAADGSYSLPHVLPGLRRVSAAQCRRDIGVRAGEVVTVDFQIPPGIEITGRVTDSETGLPIQGAVVTLGNPPVTTDAEGSYCIRSHGLNPTTWDSIEQGSVRADGYAPEPLRVVLRPTDFRVRLDVKLKREAVVTGVVRFSDGTRPRNAWVVLSYAQWKPDEARIRKLPGARTDQGGRYEIHGAPVDVLVWLHLAVSGITAEQSPPRFLLNPGQHFEHPPLIVPPPIRIHGRVVDTEGRPVERARIATAARFSYRGTTVALEDHAESREDGSFEIEFIPGYVDGIADAVQLRARWEPGGFPGPTVSVPCCMGETVNGVLLRVPETHALEIALVRGEDSLVQPFVPATAELEHRTYTLRSHDTDRPPRPWKSRRGLSLDGICRWEHLIPGRYCMRIFVGDGRDDSRRRRRAPAFEQVIEVPGDSVVRIPLVEPEPSVPPERPSTGRVRVHVLDEATSLPVVRPVLYRFLDGHYGHVSYRLTGSADEGIVAELPPGEHLLVAAGHRYPPSEPVDVRIEADLISGPVWVHLRPGKTLRGRVLLVDGSPAAFLQIRVREQRGRSEGFLRECYTDREGSFTLEGLAPAVHHLEADFFDAERNQTYHLDAVVDPVRVDLVEIGPLVTYRLGIGKRCDDRQPE